MLTPSETRAREARERPIIFSAPMVKAILAGRKTQTRRVLSADLQAAFDRAGDGILRRYPHQKGIGWDSYSHLWVKEATRRNPDLWVYVADGAEVPWPGRQAMATWTRDTGAAMYLPRSASRLTLLVERVRVERLQDISCADAIAEGIAPAANSATIDCDTPDPREDYRSLWNSLHGKDAWDANPWVATLTFQPLPASLESQKEGAAV